LTARDLLKHLGLSAVYAFVVENGEIVPEDHVLSEASQIEVINAISGG
jgi:sulfur carrier protein ThiS